MNMLRWLMKHPILLAWLLALVAILLNFGMISNKAGKGHEETVKATDHKQEQAAAPAVKQDEVVAATASVAPVAASASAPAAPVQTAAAASADQSAPAAAEPAQVAATTAPAESAPVVAPVAPSAPVQPVAPAAPSAPAQPVAPVASEPQQQVAVETGNTEMELLRAAREAYHSNEMDRAVEFYTSLLKQVPNSVQYKGELANVFWKQGNAEQAAILFAELAPVLAAQGRSTEASNMKAYVGMVKPELAQKIVIDSAK